MTIIDIRTRRYVEVTRALRYPVNCELVLVEAQSILREWGEDVAADVVRGACERRTTPPAAPAAANLIPMRRLSTVAQSKAA